MVSKKDQMVYEQVLERDQLMTWESPLYRGRRSFIGFLMTSPEVCVAPLLGASDHCSGPMTRDHVHQHAGGTKGKRAPTTMDTVVMLCWNHHLGNWAVTHRPQLREYIQRANERYRGRQAP